MPISDTLGLIFRITADSKDAQADLQQLQGKLDDLAKQNFDAAKKGLSDLGNLIKDKFSAASGIFDKFTNSLTGALGPAGELLRTMGPLGTAVAAVGGAMQLAIQSATRLGSELHDLSITTGFSVEQLSDMRVVAATAGTDLESLAQTVVRFQRNVELGGPKAQDALAKFGLTVGEVESDGVAALTKLAKNMDTLGSTSERNAALMAVMGRGAAAQIPLLDELAQASDHLRERTEALGLSFKKDFADAADKLGDNLDILKLQIEAVGQAFGQHFLQQMNTSTEATQTFTSWLIKASSALGTVTSYISNALNPFVQFKRVVDGATEAWRDFQLALGIRTQIKPEDITAITEAERKKLFEAPEKAPLPKGAISPDVISQLLRDAGEEKQRKELNKFKCFALGDCADYLKDIGYKKPPKEKVAKPDALVLPDTDPTVAAKLAEQQAEIERLRKEGTAELERELKARQITELEFASESVDLLELTAQKRIAVIKAEGEAQKDVIQQQAAARIKQAEDAGDTAESQRERERARLETKAVDIATDTQVKTILSDLGLATAKVWDDTFDKLQKRAEEFRDFEIKANEQFKRDLQKAVEVEPDTTQHDQIISDIQDTADAVGPLTAGFRGAGAAIAQAGNDLQDAANGAFIPFHQILDSMTQRMNDMVGATLQAGNGFKALGQFIGQLPYRALVAFVGALDQMVNTFIQTGKTGPAALKQLTAAVLRSLGQMAEQFAAAAFAWALWYLALQDYKDAALMTAAGIGFTAVAVALGFAASKVAPANSSAGAGAASFSATPPSTTINVGGSAQLLTSPGQAFSDLAGAVNGLNNKIGSMSPGDVVTVAASTTPGAFANGVTQATRRDASFTKELGLTLLPAT